MSPGIAAGSPTSAEELTGRQKVAVLLMALGEEASSEVTRNMSAEEVEAISFEIAQMDQVDPAVVEDVLHEWEQTERAAYSIAQGGVGFAKRILEKAFGPQKAQSILKRIETQLHDAISLDHLRKADPQQLTALIRNEHPQILALVMAYLDPEQTAAVLQELEPVLGSEVLMRMARMGKVLPDVLEVVESSLGSKSELSLSQDSARAGGPEAVADVLNVVASGLEKELLEGVAERDPELSEEIKNLMFVFEDIVNLDNESVGRLLREVDTEQLALALKVASEELKEKILGSLSSRARDALLEQMDFLGPVRVSDVENAQSEIVGVVRMLEESGEIMIGGGDELIVE